ncbi:hypothetical protein ASG49_10410 [Marmoricola sp. Leaf446]|uniref:DUF4394 domain-containing protein n=1 Tax=Marmoricola sp. Leaf446 TaxID=1736379 RepID=UPI0006F5DA0E|nr:DUF4394 domain-containing protein [Marmoricola sp. Leaf446]KQT91440.1 hypothetical protein ASG49_10410 [Marmoricola sp. Leaf446]
MNRTRTAVITAGLVAALTVPVAATSAEAARKPPARQAIGLVGGTTLVQFPVSRASKVKRLGSIQGLAGDTEVVGIDYRVQDRKLYAVGDQGGIYTLDTRARATKVSQLSVALSGTAFGVDFNPAADRLRVVSNTGQNLRHNLADDTTVVDGTLTYPATPTAPAATATGVVAAAYTNNDLDPDTATTLYDLDTALDQVVTQVPANAGTLAATGKFGLNAGGDAGFDIVGSQSTGYATMSFAGSYRLYSVDLISGDADRRGTFPRSLQVSDIALPIPR